MQKLKIPLIILFALIIAFVGYSMFLKKPAENTDEGLKKVSTSGASTGVGVKNEYRDLVGLVALLRRVNFKDKFSFSDPVFRSLVDFSQKIEKEDKGRDNPFGGDLQGSVGSSVEQLGFEEEVPAPGSQTASPTSQTPAPKTTTK